MRILICFTLIVLITGCTSASSPIQYYLLDNTSATLDNQAKTTNEVNTDAMLITLQPVILAPYLSQSSIVIEQDAHQLHYSSSHYWAQHLKDELRQIVKQSINQNQHAVLIVDQLDPRANQSDLQLKLSVEHLLPTQQSGVLLVAEYWIIDASTQQVMFTERVNFILPLERDGYPHAVEVMRKAVIRLSDSINKHIQATFARLNA